jgi:hypothetical protein
MTFSAKGIPSNVCQMFCAMLLMPSRVLESKLQIFRTDTFIIEIKVCSQSNANQDLNQ